MGVLKQQKDMLSGGFTVILSGFFVEKTKFRITFLKATLSTLPCSYKINQKLSVLRFWAHYFLQMRTLTMV